MHCLAVKLSSVVCRALTASGKAPVVTLAIVKMMIDMSIEMIPAVIPRPRAYEDAA
jgi:hypothetical protein